MIELLIAGATLAVAGWAIGAKAHQRSVASKTLERYASSRQLAFVPPTEKASPRVKGSKDEVDYVFDLYRLGDQIRTRVTCTVPVGRAPTLSFSQRGAFDWKTRTAIHIDHAPFDEAFVVAEGSMEHIELLRDVARPLLLLARREGVWLRSNTSSVSLSWLGIESNPVVLDAARDAVVMVARCHQPDAPYR